MIRRLRRHIVALTCGMSLLVIMPDHTLARPFVSDEHSVITPTSPASKAESNSQSPQGGKPYTARITIDTQAPVTYGDDVVISVWATPTVGFDLKEVRLHPKGILAELYVATQSDADQKNIPGTACRTSVQNVHAGVPFVATCRLTGIATGLNRVFNWRAVVLSSANQQFEVEIVTREGTRGTAPYYEFGSIEFASPMLSVILGGILGAALWALFLLISEPTTAAAPVSVRSWRALFSHVWKLAPNFVQRLGPFIFNFVRKTAEGGVTALVLIILAKSTVGLETPLAIQVQDIWGGLLVGIFSTYLSKWIRERVSKQVVEN